MSLCPRSLPLLLLAALLIGAVRADDRLPGAGPGGVAAISGIYPHLAMFNQENECGTGAVVPWGDRLWVITYGPHLPNGSSDKLYEIDRDLNRTVRPESVGGTPANRMIHRESGQLFIGPYAIDKQRRVRVIPPSVMPGRLTGTMRHLTDPAQKVYYATMEEGFYEVDVRTLAVQTLFPDANSQEDRAGALLPGCHGKGAYSGQGHVIYANNGEPSAEARRRPDIPSGCLAEWDGADAWTVVRRNPFCDVTGPGGIEGNPHPDTDPIWSIGWDRRSLLLMVRDRGQWTCFRLPKATHTYDGAHGWYTEWPRIRDIGEPDLLMTMHGLFWKFPSTFRALSTAGIRPRSTYLKVIGDFARWHDRVVFGCDDAARSEFLNRRKAKGSAQGPGQSNSNLWFVEPAQLDRFGPSAGHGAVWLDEPVKAGAWSDPYLFAGFERRGVHLAHAAPEPVTFTFEIDRDGHSRWQPLRAVTVAARGVTWIDFPADQAGEWVRVRADRSCEHTTVWFDSAAADRRPAEADPIFDGLARADERGVLGGLVRCRGADLRTLHLAAERIDGRDRQDVGDYELGGDMRLRRVEDPEAHSWLRQHMAIPQGVLSVDAASVLYRDDAGRRWRLPRGDEAFDALTGAGLLRIDREVVTERDLFQCHGSFYELPAEDAGGFAKIRPIATHNRLITDYASYRGLLVLTGVRDGARGAHIVRSDDGKAAVWVGAVDDLWKLGKPAGRGGPWKDTPVTAGSPSDPYLMAGYDVKRLALSHGESQPVRMRVEVDISGEGRWLPYRTFEVPAHGSAEHEFPAAFQARWLRVVADRDCTATAWLTYR